MRIFTDFCYHSHRLFKIATGLQLICEFIAQSSQTSRNLVANSQCIRKLFSRRSCDIRTNVVRMSHDVRANVAWPSQTSRTNTLRIFARRPIYRASSTSHIAFRPVSSSSVLLLRTTLNPEIQLAVGFPVELTRQTAP